MTSVSTPVTTERSAARRDELRGFLRARRAAVSPQEAGLAPGPRRRTPGLRREEVALLAGVGVTWYTWLEQGRRINASTQVLDAIARTLRLDGAQRWHLYRLAEATPIRPGRELTVSDAVRAVLHGLGAVPALLVNGRYDIIETNAAHRRLFFDWHSLPCVHHNMLWCVITEPTARERYPNYDDEVPHLVARLRAGFASHLDDPAWQEDIRRLADLCPEFARLWTRHEVAGPQERLRIMLHPEHGTVRLLNNELEVSAVPGVRLITYAAADPHSRAVLARIARDTTAAPRCHSDG